MIERIFLDLIEDGIERDIITFEMEDDQLAAHIGDYSFFILSNPNLAVNDCSFDELAELVHEAINNEPINADEEDEATECLYYLYYLEEQLGR